MSLTRHRKTTLAFTVLAILSIIFLELGFISFWSARTTSYHLDFLNFKPHSTSHPTIMADPPLTEYPDPFIREPTGPHNSTIILLHGTSQDGPTFGEAFLSFPIPVHNPINPSLSLTQVTTTLPGLFPGTRFVFPTGRRRWCTVLGRESHAWFDFVSFADRTESEEGQVEGLRESAAYLGELVESEVEILVGQMEIENREEGYRKGDARRRIVVGGFSQGAAMGCIALLSGVLGGYEGGRIGGFAGLSGWCPFRRQILEAISIAEKQLTSPQKHPKEHKLFSAVLYVHKLLGLKGLEEGDTIGVHPIPIFLGHGEDDMKMKPEWGRETGKLLGSIVMDVRWESYEGLGHWWNEREMVDLVSFFRRVWSLEEDEEK